MNLDLFLALDDEVKKYEAMDIKVRHHSRSYVDWVLY